MRLSTALMAVALITPAAAHAEPATADALAAEAEALAKAGDFVGAAGKFRDAHAADPRPELLCNVGVAFHKARDLPRAQLYLGQCLTRGGSLDPGFLASVRAVFAAVEDQLRAGDFAPIDVSPEPGGAAFTVSAFSPGDTLVGARLVWLPFGHHTLHVTADGYVARDVDVDVATRDRQAVRPALTRAPVAIVPPPPPPDRAPPGPARPSTRPAWIASGATLAVGVTAGLLYLRARGWADDAGAPDLQRDQYRDRVDLARAYQHASWVAAGLAGVGAVASGYLWRRALRTPATVDVAPTPGGVAVGVATTF
ncbi:MAG: hypothetical protein JNK64_02865 [Myxococcales bacterium]|nr:hypothetical protein [Myxococcales bacterium]